jgi:hypothetical protein
MKIALLTGALLFAATAQATTRAVPPEQSSAELRQQIQTQIADDSCDSSQQCHTLPMGAKACGGPESYVAWSDKSLDGEKLRQLGERYAAARRFDNSRTGLMSNCALTPDPGAICRAKRCVLQAPAPGQANPPAQ